jgi:hypothetical protein
MARELRTLGRLREPYAALQEVRAAQSTLAGVEQSNGNGLETVVCPRLIEKLER